MHTLYGDSIFTESSNKEIYNTINFFGKEINIVISDYYDNKQLISKNSTKINSALKAFCKKETFEYLYKTYSFELEEKSEIFGGNCKDANDLINAIKNDKKNIERGLSLFIHNKDSWINIFICGEYCFDTEHGFSINFPNGKLVTKKGNTDITRLGAFDHAL